ACTCTATSARAWLVSATSPSIPAVLRPVLRCVTCRTLTSVLAQLRSISFCTFPASGQSPPCTALKILPRLNGPAALPPYLLLLVPPVHTIPGITIQRGQALRSVHRSAQLARQYRHLRSLRLKGSPARVSALAGPSIKLAIRPVTRAPSGRRPGPAALAFLLPFSHRHSLPGPPVPPGTSAPLTIGLPPGLHLPVPAGRTLTRFPRSARMRPGPGRAPSIPRGQRCPLAVDLSTAAACRLSAADP